MLPGQRRPRSPFRPGRGTHGRRRALSPCPISFHQSVTLPAPAGPAARGGLSFRDTVRGPEPRPHTRAGVRGSPPPPPSRSPAQAVPGEHAHLLASWRTLPHGSLLLSLVAGRLRAVSSPHFADGMGTESPKVTGRQWPGELPEVTQRDRGSDGRCPPHSFLVVTFTRHDDALEVSCRVSLGAGTAWCRHRPSLKLPISSHAQVPSPGNHWAACCPGTCPCGHFL